MANTDQQAIINRIFKKKFENIVRIMKEYKEESVESETVILNLNQLLHLIQKTKVKECWQKE